MAPEIQRTHYSAKPEAGYSGIYLERNGVGVASLANELVAPPSSPLDDDDKADARQFEADMLASQVATGVSLEDVLKMPMTEPVVSPLFFAKGLIDGRVTLEGVDIPRLSSSEEVYKWVANCGLDKETLLELSKKSTDVYQERVAEALVAGQPIEETVTEARSIVLDPEDFAQNIANLRAAREMVLEKKRKLPRDTDLNDAKVAFCDIFLAKVNTLIASGIPIVKHLHDQAELTDNQALAERADNLLPAGLARAITQDESRQHLFRRLDFLRNGIGYGQDGKATGVSAKLKLGTAEQHKGGDFTLKQMQEMKEIMLSPEEMKHVFRNILSRASLLSAEDESTYSPTRTHRAADELFQVVINPTKSTFAVDSKSGVYKVSSQPQSLYDVMLVGGFHELEHINQALGDDAVGKTTKIAKIKGKRVAGLREAGANMRQRRATEKLFGYKGAYVDTYASALKALEEGGSMGDAIKAFYDARLRSQPDISLEKAAREASDRVLRLVRGGMNSQPMVYAEESIMIHELSGSTPDVQQRALAITGLDLVDQVRLHRFGLLDVPKSTSIDWSEFIMDELRQYIPA